MRKKGLFFDMMIAVMMILGVLTVIVSLFSSQNSHDPLLDFAKNYSFPSDSVNAENQARVIQNEQLTLFSEEELVSNCDEFVHNFDTDQTCYSSIIKSFFTQVDISSQIDNMSFAYSYDDKDLRVKSKQSVRFEYNTPRANVSLSRPIEFEVELDSQIHEILTRLLIIEDEFTEIRKCVLEERVCSQTTISYTRQIVDLETNLVETIFTDSLTGWKATSTDFVSDQVITQINS